MKIIETIAGYLPDKRILSGALVVCAVMGWWGALYPQFTLLESTYEIVYEDGAAGDTDGEAQGTEGMEPETDSAALYWKILDADCSQIRFRSRLLTDLKALREQGRGVHESGSQ